MADKEVNDLPILWEVTRKKLVPGLGTWGLLMLGFIVASRIVGRPEGPCIDGFASATRDPKSGTVTLVASYDEIPDQQDLVLCALKASDDTNFDNNIFTSTIGEAADNMGLLEGLKIYMSEEAELLLWERSASAVVRSPSDEVFQNILEDRREVFWKKIGDNLKIGLDFIAAGLAGLGLGKALLTYRKMRRGFRG